MISKIINSEYYQTIPTYIYEVVFVAIILFTVALCSFDLVAMLSAAACLFTFQYIQISDRLQSTASVLKLVECAPKLTYYLVCKELFFITLFLVVGAYPSVIASVIFLVYPMWRGYYRRVRKSTINENWKKELVRNEI